LPFTGEAGTWKKKGEQVAGIIAVAAADELTVAHPGERATAALVSLTLGGTALFLAGHFCELR
jgi:low temperature requirement protein LtrA